MSDDAEPTYERPRTIEGLEDYITRLVQEGKDYESSAEAMWKAAAAAFDLVAYQVGATGFQASWAALRFYGVAMGVRGPFMVTKVEDALYPQYDLERRLVEFVEESRPFLVERATERLAEYEAKPTIEGSDGEQLASAHPRVVAHWRRIVAGEFPPPLPSREADR